LETFARQRPSYFQQIDIFYQIVSAVQHLHDHGVVHRDMKPSNVVHFPAQFAWKLIDLATTARIGEVAKIVYTREYCSPEVARAVVDGAVSMVAEPTSDLWGVGVIMYELVTGQRYFPVEWTVVDGGRRVWSALCGFEPLPHEMTDVTQMRGAEKGVMKLVHRLLQRDPRLRPSPLHLLNDHSYLMSVFSRLEDIQIHRYLMAAMCHAAVLVLGTERVVMTAR
jgi:serine/threonine protein kinase